MTILIEIVDSFARVGVKGDDGTCYRSPWNHHVARLSHLIPSWRPYYPPLPFPGKIYLASWRFANVGVHRRTRGLRYGSMDSLHYRAGASPSFTRASASVLTTL